jgi:hypothetical protein
MAEHDEDEINRLKNSPIDVSGGPIGDEAFMDHRLAADLEETAAALAQAPLTAPPPFSASDVVVVIEPNPRSFISERLPSGWTPRSTCASVTVFSASRLWSSGMSRRCGQ